MSKSIGVLTLDLVARTVEFDRNLQRSQQQTRTSGNAMAADLQRVEIQAKSTGESVKTLGNTVKTAVAAFVTGSLIQQADGYTQMAARVRNATSSLSEYQVVQEHLYQTAQGTFRNLAEAQEVFLASFDGLKEAGYNTQQVLAITDSLSYSYVHNAASAEKAASATAAYGTVIDKNRVEADAWYSLIAAAPNLLNDIASATGKSTKEIRQLGAEGKLAANDLHAGLLKSRDANQALADSMENSLQDGVTKATNAIQRFTGELNMQFGVTAKAADAFGYMADNIELVAGTGAVFAVGALTTAIANKTVALKAEITAGIAARQAAVAQAEAQMQALAAESLRMRQQAALAATEVNLARAEYNAAMTAKARALAVQRLTSAEIALNIATKASTQATAAYTGAQTAAAAATTGLARAKAMALGILGGPVGLGVTVATVAASYLLLSNNAKENTQSLRDNNVSVDDAIAKYRELNATKQAGQMVEERNKLQELEKQYKQTETALSMYATGMDRANDFVSQSQLELEKLFKEYKKTGDLDQFTKSVQSSGKITQVAKDEVARLATRVNDAGSAAKTQKQFIEQLGTGMKKVGDQAKQSAAELSGMTAELEKLLKQGKSDTFKNNYLAQMIDKYNFDPKYAELLYEARKASGLKDNQPLPASAYKELREQYQSEKRLNDILDERNKKLKQEANQLTVNAKVRANAEKYNFASLESQNGLPAGLLAAVQMQESGGDTYRKGKLLTSPAGAKGSFQFMDATAKRFNVNVADMASSAQGAAKYLGVLMKRYDGNIEKAIMAYNAGEGNVDSGKAYGFKETKGYLNNILGYMAGESGFSVNDIKKSANDFLKIQEEQAEMRKQLELDVANEVTRIRSDLKDKVSEIEKAGFAPERQKELINEYTLRAENEIAVTEQALKTKLDDFGSYLLTEEALIKQSYARRQFEVQHDLSLTKAQRDQASEALRKQMVYELEQNRIAEEKDLLQIKKKWITSAEYASQYYQLVRDEIQSTASYTPNQKAMLLQQAQFEYDEERDTVDQDYRRAVGGDVDTSLDERFKDEQNAILKAYEWERITLEQYRADMLMVEQRYYNAKAQLGLESMAGMMGGWSGVFKTVLGESSGFYHAAFAMERAFTVAKATLNAPLVYTQTYAALSGIPLIGPYIAQPAAIAAAGLQIAQAATAGSVAFATGGLVRGPGTGTSDSIPARLSDYEYVVKAASVQKIGASNLDYINRTGQLPPQSNALVPNVGSGLQSVQPAAAAPQIIDNQVSVIMVKDMDEAKNYKSSREFGDAVIHHMRRNGYA
ncbi:tape measure protein [Acinetobacter variabilis]|uniref:tape measure protein n=1 Tax=Acinetobacter variabilis TaxID=70346 RepID=UPI001BB7F728|nr:tape measure protein [Acinetobacter variabilis]BCT88167.1 hypothetical protein RYU24_05720 [Acinetobacter variabilis]